MTVKLNDYIELCSIGGGSGKYDPSLWGIRVNGVRASDWINKRDFTLFLFNEQGKITSTHRYDLYLGKQNGNLVDSNRMVNDLNSLPDGQVFALITYDEPSNGHYLRYDNTTNTELIDAMVRIGANREQYAREWHFWSAYMLINKVGSPTTFFEVLDETPPVPPRPPYPYSDAGILKGFSVLNNTLMNGAVLGNPNDPKRQWIKNNNVWRKARKIFTKINGQWVLSYVRNRFDAYSLGMVQNTYDPKVRGIVVNNKTADPSIWTRSWNLHTFNEDGTELTSVFFDLFADNGGTTNASRLATALNALPSGKLFVVTTFDEPSLGHLSPGLPEAIYRIGGTPEVYGQPMNYRGAYMLVGKVGNPAYFERYVGESVNPGNAVSGGDPNAHIHYGFKIVDNSIYQAND